MTLSLGGLTIILSRDLLLGLGGIAAVVTFFWLKDTWTDARESKRRDRDRATRK